LDSVERPAVYAPDAQRPFFWLRWTTFAVRTATDPAQASGTVRAAILETDPDLPVYGISSMEKLMAEAVAGRRYTAALLGIFAALALLLAAVGIYGVTALAVHQRTREIGVRLALGARRRSIVAMILGQGLWLTFLGIGIGLAGALALTRYLESLLFQVTPTDPATFTGVAAFLAAVAAVACCVPARRAVRMDPITVLRCE
jgi:putative ABC transport system permease protein